MASRERKEFIEDMFTKLESAPVASIVGKRVSLKCKGRHYMGLCPFHNDTSLGSFVVTPDKNVWACFACGEDRAGNGVHFVELYENLHYLEAAFKVALEEGIISQSEFDTYSSAHYEKKYVEQIEKKYKKTDRKDYKKKAEKKAPSHVIHNVYTFMRDYCGLSEKHREVLSNERKLQFERIREDYFTFPMDKKDEMVAAIKEKFPQYSDEMLSIVPGFYYDKKRNCVSYAGYKGIAIIIRDSYGFAKAVQIRRDTIKEGEKRYMWFSSTFAIYDDKYSGGAGTESPQDVLLPSQENAKHCICITEGRFKSEMMMQYGNYTISVQGVGNWDGIEREIREIMDVTIINQFFIMYDADMLGNSQVVKHAYNLACFIKEKFPDIRVRIGTWPIACGKGIDDVIIAENISQVRYFEPDEIYSVFNKNLVITVNKWGFKTEQELIKALPVEKRILYKAELQEINEQELLKVA